MVYLYITCKPLSAASTGVSANSLQLTWSGNYVNVLYIERNTGAMEEIQWIDNFHISLELLLPPPLRIFLFPSSRLM
jgi:hypothetical protein